VRKLRISFRKSGCVGKVLHAKLQKTGREGEFGEEIFVKREFNQGPPPPKFGLPSADNFKVGKPKGNEPKASKAKAADNEKILRRNKLLAAL